MRRGPSTLPFLVDQHSVEVVFHLVHLDELLVVPVGLHPLEGSTVVGQPDEADPFLASEQPHQLQWTPVDGAADDDLRTVVGDFERPLDRVGLDRVELRLDQFQLEDDEISMNDERIDDTSPSGRSTSRSGLSIRDKNYNTSQK